MKKTIILVLGILLTSLILVSANENHQTAFEEGKNLIESKVSCDNLSDEQLETIGDYLMEQIHSGEAHEAMDEMMGGEGSESLKQMHINMAKTMYCGEGGSMMGSGMMGGSGSMMGMMSMMMGGNIMNEQNTQTSMMQGLMNGQNNQGSLMGSWGYGFGYSFWNILWSIFLIGVIALIIWFIYRFTKKGKESETPVNILQKRYAKGDISKKQFEGMKKELKE